MISFLICQKWSLYLAGIVPMEISPNIFQDYFGWVHVAECCHAVTVSSFCSLLPEHVTRLGGSSMPLREARLNISV
jgi:hypothetical protein